MNKKTNFLGTTTFLSKLYWLAAGLFFLYFQIFEAPRKGFNVSDMGYSMTAARDLTQGIISTGTGLAPLVNALLIKLGFNYLNITRFYYSLQFFSALLFIFSLRIRTKTYWLCPLAACLMLTPMWEHMANYQTLGPLILTTALSFLFITQKYDLTDFLKSFFYGLSALLLTFSSVSCTILIPSLFINAVILFFVYPKIRNKTFIITYWASATIFLYLMLAKIVPIALSSQGLQHWIKLITIPSGILLMIMGGFLLGKLLLTFFLLDPGIYQNYKLSNKEHNHSTKTIVLILSTFFIYGGQVILQPHNIWDRNFTSIFSNNFLYSLVFFGTILATYRPKELIQKHYIPILLTLTLQIEYYIGLTASDWMPWQYRAQFFSGVVPLAVFCFLEQKFATTPSTTRGQKTIILIILMISSYFAPIKNQHNWNWGGGSSPTLNTELITNIPKLHGLYDQPRKIEQLEKIIQTYKKNNCQNKLFITRKTILLPYYLLNRFGQAPMYIFSSRDLDQLKAAKKGFCYLTDAFFELNLFNSKIAIKTKDHQFKVINKFSKINPNTPIYILGDATPIRIKNYREFKKLRQTKYWLTRHAHKIIISNKDHLTGLEINQPITFYVK